MIIITKYLPSSYEYQVLLLYEFYFELSHLILTPWDRYYYPNFVDDKTRHKVVRKVAQSHS